MKIYKNCFILFLFFKPIFKYFMMIKIRFHSSKKQTIFIEVSGTLTAKTKRFNVKTASANEKLPNRSENY